MNKTTSLRDLPNVNGIIKGNGTSGFSAAVEGTDYQGPIVLTTIGTSGTAGWDGTTLNIPDYANNVGSSGTSGQSGATGSSGSSGSSGQTGGVGSSGSSGQTGAAGSSGSSGSSGTSGTSGSSGSSGQTGAAGSSGSSGSSGQTGAAGSSGSSGQSGAAGSSGSSGSSGQSGAAGSSGSSGQTGAAGSSGSSGSSGQSGAAGSSGTSGSSGSSGTRGSSGSSGSSGQSGAAGSSGSSGQTGGAGSSGSSGSSGQTGGAGSSGTSGTSPAAALSTDIDSEQTVASRIHYFNSGAGRINFDPRWNESGYDADLGCLHLWSWTAAGAAYGRAGIAFYSDTAYQYLTTKSNTTGLYANNSLILTASNYNSYSPTLTGTGASGNWSINVTGTAGSTKYLSTLGSYVQSASTPATSQFLGITSSFVSSAEGWIDYGSLMTVMTYPGGGGTLQLYTPYSTIYGGSRLVYRSSDYNTGAWTGWKYLLNSSSDPYAYNMNQDVRTSDSPSFSGLRVNSNTTTGTSAGVINLGTTSDPSDIANTSIVGLTWGLRGDSQGYYIVRSNRMTYGGYTYNRLDLSWHTGIVIGAATTYGGIRFWNNSTNIGSLIASIGDGDNNMRSTADIIAYASDKRLKENVINIPNALDKIKQINGVYFDWKDKTKELGFNPSQKNDVGVIAQEIQAILPEVVTLAPFDYELGKSKSGENYLTVKYDKLAPLFIEAIKELNQKVEDQQKIINDLLRR